MYKKINKRWSFRVFKRNRVQVLTFGVILTASQFIKITFMWDYGDLLILLLGQLLRFLIWSLTLRNFLKSGMDLMIKTYAVKIIIRVLQVSIVVGACFFVGYAVYLVVQESVYNANVLTCQSPEFVIQASLNLAIVIIFLISACSTTKMIRAQIQMSKDDPTFLAINESRRVAMSNVWMLLIWLLVVAVESWSYSFVLLMTSEEECLPMDIPQWWKDLIAFVDRELNYQLWFIPLIWLFWPSNTRKKENRSRRRAMD